MLTRLSILLIFFSGLGGIQSLYAQSAGGRAVYSFLGLPAGVQQTSLGGENVSTFESDLALSVANPALLRDKHSQKISLSFTPMPAGVKQLFAAGAYRHEKSATNLAMQVKYIGYGSLQATDPAGNNYGEFNPRDYLIQFTASRKYLERWHYGAAVKFIQSNYGAYRSSALAMDIGVNYYDSSARFQAGLVMRNMGFQLRSYSGEGSENLPFDLQIGITKRLAKAPLQFSLTARELHRLILYKPDSSTSTFDQIAQHFVLGAQTFIGQNIELGMGYNHLRRKELMIPSTANGLTGFSTGIGLLFSKFQIRYAHAWYTSSKGYNQVGLSFSLN